MEHKRADVVWLGNSKKVLKSWPPEVMHSLGTSLGLLQHGKPSALPSRPMKSVAAGVFELKEQDASQWYRLMYAARIEDNIYVLHCFTKKSAKTEASDLNLARQRWKQLQRDLQEKKNAERKGNY